MDSEEKVPMKIGKETTKKTMATGDLPNNIRKLKVKLKAIKYTEDLDVAGLAEGTATTYLPLYHYAFTSYSPALAEQILGKDIELYGKSDARFMEAIYKVLRDMFSYKPPVTKEQFFAKGFVERKVIMCTEILQLIKTKHSALNPAPSKTAMKTSVRPKSAAETRHLSAVPTKANRLSGKLSPRGQEGRLASPRQQGCVVNELTSLPSNQPVRKTATSHHQSNAVRHIVTKETSHNAAGGQEVVQRHISDISTSRQDGRPVRHVSIKTPPESSRLGINGDVDMDGLSTFDGSPEHLQMRPTYMCHNTPSISRACPNSVEVVCMPRGVEEDQSIVEIRAPTSDSLLQGPVPQSQADTEAQITHLYQTVEALTEHVVKFDTTVRGLQDLQGVAGGNLEPHLKPVLERLDNLIARMVLLENRVSIIEYKVDDVNRSTTSTVQSDVFQAPPPAITDRPPVNMPRPPATIPHPSVTLPPYTATPLGQTQGSSFSEDLKAMVTNGHLERLQSHFSEGSDLSLNYSPIRKATNGTAGQMFSANEETFALETEDDARRSSTPTMGGTFMGDSSLCCNFNDTNTNDAVSRIKNMMKETKQMMTTSTPEYLIQQPSNTS